MLRYLFFLAVLVSAEASASDRSARLPAPPLLLPASDDFRDAMLDWSQAPAQMGKVEQFQLPVVSRRYSSLFGIRHDPLRPEFRAHLGVDIPGAQGAPVYASASGVVVFAGWARGYGNLVRIAHGGGAETRYAHLSTIDVIAGGALRQGEELGRIGSTGRSTGPHLHFEVRDFGRPVDPLPRLGDPLQPTGFVDPLDTAPIAPPVPYDSSDLGLPVPFLAVSAALWPSCNASQIKTQCSAPGRNLSAPAS